MTTAPFYFRNSFPRLINYRKKDQTKVGVCYIDIKLFAATCQSKKTIVTRLLAKLLSPRVWFLFQQVFLRWSSSTSSHPRSTGCARFGKENHCGTTKEKSELSANRISMIKKTRERRRDIYTCNFEVDTRRAEKLKQPVQPDRKQFGRCRQNEKIAASRAPKLSEYFRKFTF